MKTKNFANIIAILGLVIAILTFFFGDGVLHNKQNNNLIQSENQNSISDKQSNIRNQDDEPEIMVNTKDTTSNKQKDETDTVHNLETGLSFKPFIGKWKLHSTSYNARRLECEINIDSVDEANKTVTLTYYYDLASVIADNHTTGQKTITVNYKNEEIKMIYPDKSKGVLQAITTDIFNIEHYELGKIHSYKLAVAVDGNIYANFTENGSYDYDFMLCTK